MWTVRHHAKESLLGVKPYTVGILLQQWIGTTLVCSTVCNVWTNIFHCITESFLSFSFYSEHLIRQVKDKGNERQRMIKLGAFSDLIR